MPGSDSFKNKLAFLSGGGEMGRLIREKDWSATPLGKPESWPQSLRTMVSVVLENPFGMYIAWGNEYIQMYNDGYRPILGTTKHPQALGISSRKTFEEAWPTVGPMFEGVMQGTPIGFPDFILHLDRNGFIEECIFDFSYSPIRLENGEVGGVLVTVIETTEKVNNFKKLTEVNDQLNFAIEATELGTWDFNPLTNKFSGNNRLKEWFGLPNESEIELSLAINVIIEKDKKRVLDAIQKVLQYESGGHYDIQYTIINPITNQQRIIRAKGRAWFGEDKKAYRFNGTIQDVTEQAIAGKKIEESENQFRSFADSIQNLAWIAYGDGSRYWFNQRWYDYTGTTFEELKGYGWEKIHHPNDVKKVMAFLTEAWGRGEPFEITIRLRRHDGAYQWFLTRAFPVKDTDGTIVRWIGTNTDITEQKSFSEELKKKVKEHTYELHIQNETFKQAEESSMQGSYSFNLTSGNVTYSDNLFRLIGYEPNEFKPSIEEFNKHVHQDDKDYVKQATQEVVNSITAQEWHYRMNTKLGAVINIKGTGRVIESGDEKLLVGTLQDVTKEFELNKELQEKEEYLKQIINNAPDAVIVINEKNIITLWNPKTEEIFGWKAAEVVGMDLSDTIVPTQYREHHREGMKRFIKTGESRILNKTLELSAINKKGKELPISLTISQAKQEGTKLFIAFIRDITIEKQNRDDLIVKTQQLEEMNQSLESKNLELENSNEELASFNYIANHDLQEPLRKIQTFSNLILDNETFTGKTQNHFNSIILASTRMRNLLASLLNFSSIGSAKLILEPCNLNTIVEESKDDLLLIINEKQVNIEYHNLSTINGVPVLLSQLLTNLLSNAIKYCRPDVTPHIKITTSILSGNEIEHPTVHKEKEYHTIKIIDNGIGFEKEYAEKIFGLFQRLHPSNEYSGTGIGLAIVKKIISYHNGYIMAEGIPNVGSTFTIYIPTTKK